MADKQVTMLIIGIVVAILINFVPSAIAYVRRHPDRALLARLNILSILSFLLWLALLVWAAGGQRNEAVISRFVHSRAQRPLLIGLLVLLVGGGVAATALTLNNFQ